MDNLWKITENWYIPERNLCTGTLGQRTEDSNLSLRENCIGAQDRYDWETIGSGVAVWSDRPHIVTKGLDVGQPDAANPCVFHFTGLGWKSEFAHFVGTLSVEDRQSCSAVPYSDYRPVEPWHSMPLDNFYRQVTGHWLQALLDEDRLICHYQPIYSLKTCRVVGYEALARGLDPAGLKSGLQLIEAARQIDILPSFDEIARSAAFTNLSRVLDPHESLFINISPAIFRHGFDCLTSTLFAARIAQVEPHQVIFEFVEAEQFPDEDALEAIATEIRALGARIALDDFGAGHSTLEVAERLRPDIIKFDRSLFACKNLESRESVIRGLVEFCHAIGALTVAEGIETESQLSLVDRCGIDYVQGYLIGRPAADLRDPGSRWQMSLVP